MCDSVIEILIPVFTFSPENIYMTLKVANESKLFGEQYSWFAGTKVKFKPN